MMLIPTSSLASSSYLLKWLVINTKADLVARGLLKHSQVLWTYLPGFGFGFVGVFGSGLVPSQQPLRP